MAKNNDLIIIILTIIAFALFFVNLTSISPYYNLITGRATDSATGSANVTVTAVTQINISTSVTNGTNLTFGSGYVLNGYTFCAISSQSTSLKSSGCSSGLISPGANFTIENTGNKNLTVNISSDKNAAAFIGGTVNTPVFNYIAVQTAENGCTGVISNVSEWYPLNTTTIQICSQLGHISTEDTIQLAINISIPENSLTGALGATITFTGLSA